MVDPTHTVPAPEMLTTGAEVTFTVSVAVAVPQLLVTVYVTISIPTALPETTPPLDTVATPPVPEKTPPPEPVSVMDEPTHTEVGPVIEAVGNAFMVTILVAVAVPQLFV
jgi:hypothetical protein